MLFACAFHVRWKSVDDEIFMLYCVCVCVSTDCITLAFCANCCRWQPPLGTHPTIPLVIQWDESRSLSLFTNACSPDACLSYLLTLILTLHCRDAINCIAVKVKSGCFASPQTHAMCWADVDGQGCNKQSTNSDQICSTFLYPYIVLFVFRLYHLYCSNMTFTPVTA